jgi:hypothetical protein
LHGNIRIVGAFGALECESSHSALRSVTLACFPGKGKQETNGVAWGVVARQHSDCWSIWCFRMRVISFCSSECNLGMLSREGYATGKRLGVGCRCTAATPRMHTGVSEPLQGVTQHSCCRSRRTVTCILPWTLAALALASQLVSVGASNWISEYQDSSLMVLLKPPA